MREQITLCGDDAEWFGEIKESIAADRGGKEPGNAETLRLLMAESDHPEPFTRS